MGAERIAGLVSCRPAQRSIPPRRSSRRGWRARELIDGIDHETAARIEVGERSFRVKSREFCICAPPVVELRSMDLENVYDPPNNRPLESFLFALNQSAL